MPEYYNNILCVSKPELTDGNPPVMTAHAYDKYVRRHPHVRLRMGKGKGTPALLSWELLREDLKRRYRAAYGDPRAAAGPCYTLKKLIEPDYKAGAFYATHLIADNTNLPAEKQREYATNASVLNAVIRMANEGRALRKALGSSKKVSWTAISEQVNALRDELKHSLPANALRLSHKVAQYKTGGYASLVSGKFLNKNAGKVVDPQQESIMRQLLRKHNNFDNAQIASVYNSVAAGLGWDSITSGTVANLRKGWGLETYSGRHGESAWDNSKAMLVKRTLPTQPLYYWTADGWEVELLYQKTDTDASGNSRTTYHNRLTVVVVLDPSHQYPVGYAIGERENPELIKAAMRNAIQHTAELFGRHYKTLQLQTDNYSKKKLTPIYEAISGIYTPARVHNAKSKVVEPYFKKLNKKYCQMQPNWAGFGITAKKTSQPNAQYLNKIHGSFPDEAGCRRQIIAMIEAERAERRTAYVAAFEALPEEDKHTMEFGEYMYLLGDTTGFTNRLSAAGLVVTIDGVKREYDSFDVAFRRHADVDWVVKYDPTDCSRVLACSTDGRLRFELEEKYVQPMALRDRKPGDSAQLKRIGSFNRQLKSEIMENMQQDYNTVAELFETHPQLEGTLAKLILVDSNGQHKDNRNAARLGAARKELARQNKQIETAQERTWAQEQEAWLDSKVDFTKFLNQS